MRITVLGLVLIIAGCFCVANAQEDYAAASVTLVREFISFEIAGGRLTDGGWQNATKRFFLHAEPSPSKRDIWVVSRKFSVKLDRFMPATDATVEADFEGCYGHIDSQLRLRAQPDRLPNGVIIRAECWSTYHVGASRIVASRVDTTPEAASSPTLTLDRDTAIRYVAEMRQKATDAAMKKNADATLAALRKLKAE